MEITVTLNIDDNLLKANMTAAANAMFKPHDRYSAPPDGYVYVLKAVSDAIAEMDLRDLAREATAKYARGIVEDVTKETLRKMAREAIREERASGTLFGSETNER